MELHRGTLRVLEVYMSCLQISSLRPVILYSVLVGLVFTLKFFSTRLACIEEANENIQLISRGTKYCGDHWVQEEQRGY